MTVLITLRTSQAIKKQTNMYFYVSHCIVERECSMYGGGGEDIVS